MSSEYSSEKSWTKSYKFDRISTAKIFALLAIIAIVTLWATAFVISMFVPPWFASMVSPILAAVTMGVIGYFSTFRICTSTGVCLIGLFGLWFFTISDE